MSNDGSTAMSVGTDKFIRIWDVRMKSQVAAIDGTAFAEMNEICYSSSPLVNSNGSEGPESYLQFSMLNGLACVGHVDGTLTFWDMKMRNNLA